MLTVAKVTGQVAGTYADYLQAKTRSRSAGDYYQHDGDRVEAPGRWVRGHQAVGADSSQPVTGGHLADLMAVRYPGTDRPLRPAGGTGEAVSAIDATFSAPKSVSAAWAIADPALRVQIEHAHEAAVDGAVAYSLEHVNMVRRRVGGRSIIHEPAIDLVATSWRHTTARAVDGRAPDPQLHSHVLLHAAVRGDGNVVAIDSRAWFVHRREVGAAYRTHLAHELNRLGFQIERSTGRGGRYFEISGVPQTLLDRWSGRARQIEAEITRRLTAKLAPARPGTRLTPAEDRQVRITTRAQKHRHPEQDLDHDWAATAQAAGLSPAALARLRSARLPLSPASQPELISALTEFDATFSDREMRAVTLERSAGALPSAALAAMDTAQSDGEILPLENGRYTTRQHRSTERRVLASTHATLTRATDKITPGATARAASVINERLEQHGGRLSTEQRAALTAATGPARLVMIDGHAGTGKSTVMQAVALAHHHDGRDVIVTSTSALAAQRLADDLGDAGVPAAPYSTAALDHAIRNDSVVLGPGVTVIHDEAALASTQEQARLHGAIEQSGARLILIGDHEQSRPVGAGGLWPHLSRASDDAGVRVTLSENLRARDPDDRHAQQQFREQNFDGALGNYRQRDRIQIRDTLAEAEHTALLAAHRDRQAGHRTLIIAQTSNQRLDDLNLHAQALRLHDGELGTGSIPVPGRPYALHAGDEIQIRRTLSVPGHAPVRNGTTASVTALDACDRTLELTTSHGDRIALTANEIADADLRLSYAQHPFPAQGETSDRTHLIASEHATRHGAYVAITRARDRTTIHVGADHLAEHPGDSTIDQLADILSRDEPDIPSIDLRVAGRDETFNDRVARRFLGRDSNSTETLAAHDYGYEP